MFQFIAVRSLASVVTLSVLLSACGGSAGDTPPAPSAATEISAENMNVIAGSALLSAETADASSVRFNGNGQSTGAIVQADAATTSSVAALDAAARVAPPAMATSPVVPPQYPLIPIAELPCPQGGTMKSVVIDANSNNIADKDEVTRLDFYSCKMDDETQVGSVDVTTLATTVDAGVLSSANMIAAFSFTTQKPGHRDLSFGGRFSLDMVRNGGLSTTTIQGSSRVAESNGQTWMAVALSDFRATVSERSSGLPLLDVSTIARFEANGVATPIGGTLHIQTTRSMELLYLNGGRALMAGGLRITVPGKPAVLDVTVDGDTTTLALDADGNGTIDVTRTVEKAALRKLF